MNSTKEHSLRKTNRSTIFLTVFLILIIIVGVWSYHNPDFGSYFSLSSWFQSDDYAYIPFWTAVGFTMLACFLGALVPIPIPYAIPITIFSSIWINSQENAWVCIMVLIILSALSNAVGDFIDYLIGEGAEYILERDDPTLQNRWAKKILKNPQSIPYIIVLFAVSPLPDSLLLVPLGFVKYSKKKVMGWMLLGKTIMMLMWALAGIYAFDFLLTYLESSDSEYVWMTGVGLLVLVWLILVIMMKAKPKKGEN